MNADSRSVALLQWWSAHRDPHIHSGIARKRRLESIRVGRQYVPDFLVEPTDVARLVAWRGTNQIVALQLFILDRPVERPKSGGMV
jgi:hypothetical protein